MTLIHNERTKLLAGALNTAATSCFTIGVLAPMAAAFYNVKADNPVSIGLVVAGLVVWLFAAVVLHIAARRVLGELKE
jgi:multisubunit Na+/H+ antiporter MnhG subunit